MRIHERSRFFVLDFVDGNGKRRRHRFKTREEAERAALPSVESDFSRIARHYLAYIKANKRPETYKTAKYVMHSAIRGGLTKVTVDAVAAYLASREKTVTPATRACDARYLRAAFRMAETDGLIAKAPKVRAPRVPRKAIFTLSEDQKPGHDSPRKRLLPDIVDRFNGIPNTEGDTSESGSDFSLACKLAIFGINGQDIGNTLRASWKQRGLANRDTRTYLQTTVEKALAFAEKSRMLPAIPQPEEKQPGDEIMHWVRDARRIRDIAIANPEHVHAAYGIFEVGQCHVLAGKSSVGKSALAIWFGAHWAEGALQRLTTHCSATAVGMDLGDHGSKSTTGGDEQDGKADSTRVHVYQGAIVARSHPPIWS